MVDPVLENDYPHRSLKDKGIVLKIHTDDNVADLLTKAFDVSFIAFRGSLRRVNDGTEALLILPLFILWLDKVSTASAKLVPMGKVCTAIETLKKNSAKGNAEFHEIIDFLKRSSIHHALRHITAKVAGKSVSISEASIRSDLFDDADRIDLLPNQAIFDAIQLMGEVPIEHQPNLSPKTLHPLYYHDSVLENFCENLGGHSSSDKSLSGNEGDMTLQSVYDICLSLCAQVSDQAKEIQLLKAQITKLKKQAKPVKRDPLFDTIPEDSVDHIKTENAQDEGRIREMVDEDKEIDEIRLSTEDVLSTDKEVVSTDKEGVSTDKEKVSTNRPIVSTDGSKISTDEHIEGTEEHNEGTEEHNEGTEEHIEGTEEKVESTDGQRKGTKDQTEEEIAAQQTQTHTSTVFGDDETMAKVLLNMSQAKAISREKKKGVELKDIEEADKPRPTSTRSLLTLKPLPKINPKDKGKKMIEEEDESESESDGKCKKSGKKMRKRNRIAEEKVANEALIRNFDDIKARIEADRLLAEKLSRNKKESNLQ
ncbi:hypothetical protein Tco_1328212 [Tanacetum coccineum]